MKKQQIRLHPGQVEAWNSTARITAVLAGTQGGKTSFGPLWLWREMRMRGPGDYIVVTPTFPLLELKALPEFRYWFEQTLGLGRYVASPVRKFVLSDRGAYSLWHDKPDYLRAAVETPTNVYFGYAADSESLESATAKAAWLDEAGQRKFKLGSWEAIRRRLALAQGRILITTTPYSLGWLKQQVWDKRDTNPEIQVVRFESIMNPLFPHSEWEWAKQNLPAWKFDMFYRAIFSRPAGMIYDCFDDGIDVVDSFDIPDDWPRYLGLDFGGVNTAGLFYAMSPNGTLYLYREYHAGGLTAKGHIAELLRGEPVKPLAVGGAASEGQWRNEFTQVGLPVIGSPIKDVEVGIDRVYGMHKQNKIKVFRSCTGYLDEKMTYARELNDVGEPTEKIEDKNDFHRMDAERYVISYLNPTGGKPTALQGFWK